MDLCKEKIYGTENLREYRSQPRSSPPVEGLMDVKAKTGALNLMCMDEDGETDGGEYEEHDDSIEGSVTPPVTPISDSDAVGSQSSPLPCRNYRVVSNTCADSTSKKPLRLTLRAASPKEDSPPSTSLLKPTTSTSSYQRLSPPEPYQRVVASSGNGLSPLKIVTSLSAASSPNVAKANVFFQSRVPGMEHVHGTRPTAANSVHRNRSRASRTRAVNKKPRRTTVATSTIPQRKSRTSPEPTGRPSPRRSNGKRSSGGPTLNGYGVPASIEGMSSMKDFINLENFMGFEAGQQHTLASMLPRMDIIEDEFGHVTISDSALKNEYFTKSLKEYLNKGYRVAAMTSQRYPLSTGHNTRQRRRNEFQGVDLSPKDEWKMMYFEKYWGEKTEARESPDPKNDLNDECKSQLDLKQPIVKLTRAESVGSDDCLLKSSKLDMEGLDTTSEDPEVLSQLDLCRPSSQTKTRKRRQRDSRDISIVSNDTLGTRKRRRKQASNPQLLHRGNQLCMTLPPSDNLSSPASALSFVDEHSKSSAAAKAGSASGPSNNSSSSPSTYGETSPPNEEMGTPTEFIKPRPPPPQPALVSRDKPMVNHYFQFTSSVSGGPGSLGNPSGGRHAGPLASSSTAIGDGVGCGSRLAGKTVGEQRRELACLRPITKPTPVLATAASLVTIHPPATTSSTPRVRRKYATAARHFEKQLKQKESEAQLGTQRRRHKKSHDARLKRLRKRNALAASVDEGSTSSDGIKNLTQGLAVEDSSPMDAARLRNSDVPTSILASYDPNKSAICSSSSHTISAIQRLIPLKTSSNVLRTSDGVSFVFRDRVCPITLASAFRRHPEVNISVSFLVPDEKKVELQTKLKAAVSRYSSSSSKEESGPSTHSVLRWVEKTDSNLVCVTFDEEAVSSDSAECKSERSVSPVLWSLSNDVAMDCGQSDSGSQTLHNIASSTSVPCAHSETDIVGCRISLSGSHGISSHQSRPDELLRKTASKVFRGQMCLEQRSFPLCPPQPSHPPDPGPSLS